MSCFTRNLWPEVHSHTSSLQNPEWRSKIKKDPGIPNLFPFKDKLLHDIEEKKSERNNEFKIHDILKRLHYRMA